MLIKLYGGIFRTLAYLIPAGYSKPCQLYKMMRHIENSDIVRTAYSGIFKQNQEHSAIFSHVQAYWEILGPIETLLRHIEPYPDIFRTLCHPCICNSTMLRTLIHLELEESSKACRKSKLIKHIQMPGIVRTVYSSIFKDVQGYSGILIHIQPNSLVDN